jgi:hypothetical protein
MTGVTSGASSSSLVDTSNASTLGRQTTHNHPQTSAANRHGKHRLAHALLPHLCRVTRMSKYFYTVSNSWERHGANNQRVIMNRTRFNSCPVAFYSLLWRVRARKLDCVRSVRFLWPRSRLAHGQDFRTIVIRD